MERGSSVVALETVHPARCGVPSTGRLTGFKNAGFKNVVGRQDGCAKRSVAKFM